MILLVVNLSLTRTPRKLTILLIQHLKIQNTGKYPWHTGKVTPPSVNKYTMNVWNVYITLTYNWPMSYKKKLSVFDTQNINMANTQYIISEETQVNWEHNRRTNRWTSWMHIHKANASLQVTSSKSTETTYHISKCMRCTTTSGGKKNFIHFS